MSENPTPKELEESINTLRSYRDRLKEEIINVSQKLKIPKNKVDTTLKESTELQNIEKALSNLLKQSQKK